MNLILLFFALIISTVSKEYLNIKSAIENLHKNTSYSTFYELFGSSRFTKISNIQKKFMKMLRSKQSISDKLDLKQSKELLTTSFDILKRHRKEYDTIINSYALMFDDSRNYKTSRIMVFLSLLCTIICLDLIYFCVRYVKYSKNNKVQKLKKKGKKTVQVVQNTSPKLIMCLIYSKIKCLLKKK